MNCEIVLAAPLAARPANIITVFVNGVNGNSLTVGVLHMVQTRGFKFHTTLRRFRKAAKNASISGNREIHSQVLLSRRKLIGSFAISLPEIIFSHKIILAFIVDTD